MLPLLNYVPDEPGGWGRGSCRAGANSYDGSMGSEAIPAWKVLNTLLGEPVSLRRISPNSLVVYPVDRFPWAFSAERVE